MDRHKDQRYASVRNCPSNPGACCDCRTPPRIWRFFLVSDAAWTCGRGPVSNCGDSGAHMEQTFRRFIDTTGHERAALRFIFPLCATGLLLDRLAPGPFNGIRFCSSGNFEDAVHTWRTLRQPWIAANDTVLATVGGGALGAPLTAPHTAEYPDMDALPIGWVSSPLPDATYSPAALQRAAGLVWRAVVLWMVLLLMLTCAVWLG